jgi:hypothetical protein
MKSQLNTKTSRRTLAGLTSALALAAIAVAPAAARPDTDSGADAIASHTQIPTGENANSNRSQPSQTHVRKTYYHLDDFGLPVNTKGFRAGGATLAP